MTNGKLGAGLAGLEREVAEEQQRLVDIRAIEVATAAKIAELEASVKQDLADADLAELDALTRQKAEFEVQAIAQRIKLAELQRRVAAQEQRVADANRRLRRARALDEAQQYKARAIKVSDQLQGLLGDLRYLTNQETAERIRYGMPEFNGLFTANLRHTIEAQLENFEKELPDFPV